MRISDWSSDVCSSDLLPARVEIGRLRRRIDYEQIGKLRIYIVREECFRIRSGDINRGMDVSQYPPYPLPKKFIFSKKRNAHRSEERRVGKEVSVRVYLGGRRIIKKKTNIKITK